ncbi:tetratricopeptide repeat protein [Mucilaginibacter sp. X5P1]|uniref:tetratricopeptide repeat protein n=1 Tax=Mucilaginibacter sp. X5P1 TaxID=2723088 RepID=UPI00161449B2|nr:tetratricopeptide repeat protein [Mucilaginibacter sp. X5P1]MBB6137628.1 tetratricopeptide (TPR) repeat protein [Mucilaginibacter sp. X5P1]
MAKGMIHEDILLRNNTGNKTKQSLVEGFVIRINEFHEIYYNLQQTSLLNHKQHYLIIGQRGTGKTSLMHRLNYAIEDDKKLNEHLIPIVFTEEQYYLSELVNIWENVAIHLEDQYGWSNVTRIIENIIADGNDYEQNVYDYLCNKLRNANKTLVLFIENINVFFNKLDERELVRLKDILINDSAIRLVGTSTSFDDGYIDFASHFFSFFKIIQIDGLTKDECEQLLLKIGEQYGQLERIKHIIEYHPGRIESLRRLTGGIPRTISYLFQIFLDNENGKAIKDLYILIDTLSLLYKSELDQLSTQQQKVIDIIARKWDAIPVRDIVKATRLESKNISKIIATLEKDQLIEKVSTDTKNHLYRIKERFMNIWYLMRFGRKHDKENVIWLVRFFDAWCEKKELDKLIAAHIDNLKDGAYDINAAIDMGNTFLSCVNVSDSLKSELFRITKSILPERLLNTVKWATKNEHSTLSDLITEQKFAEAIEMLGQIETRDTQYYTLASSLYLMTGDYERSAEAAKQVLALDETNAKAALTLGIIYEDFLKDMDKAVLYYKQSLSQQPYHPYAANRLGEISFYKEQNYKAAVDYHNLAVKKIYWPSLLSLGKIYLHRGNYKKAEKYLLEALDHKVKDVNVELGKLYARIRDAKKAKISFEKAIESNDDGAFLEYGKWNQYKTRPDYEKARVLFNKAIEVGDVKAYGYLGKLYHRKLNDKGRALEIYSEGMKHGDASSVHQLAHLYAERKDYDKADELFIKANDMGDHVAILCMVSNIYSRGRKDKKEFALEALEKNLKAIDGIFTSDVFYAKILLWNNNIEKSVDVVRSLYSEIAESKLGIDESLDDFKADNLLSELMSYFLLLLAKEEYKVALDFFADNAIVDFKGILKPVYFVLMDILKKEYPLEYLKAGEEFKDTIEELKISINRLKIYI